MLYTSISNVKLLRDLVNKLIKIIQYIKVHIFHTININLTFINVNFVNLYD